MADLIARLTERKLVQWSVAYLAGGWLVLQVTDLLGDRFGWPEPVFRITAVLLAVGFLAALVLAWFHGEQGQQRAGGVELLMLGGILVLAAAAVALVRSPGGEEVPVQAQPTAPEPASLVVLPFLDLSPLKDQEYFSDGLTEEILNALVRIPGLRVPARTTSFAFKGKNLPVTEIARQLNVAHVLEGSVRKADDRLRITAQLVEARTDRHLWSETYDRDLSDVFAVQEEIARAVVEALQVRLAPSAGLAPTGGGAGALVAVGTSHPAVYEAYLRGLYLWNRRTVESLRQAEGYFQEAVERDPSFARGWAGLALTYVLMPEYAHKPGADWMPRAMDAARRALELDPELAEAHTALGYALLMGWDMEAAESEFRRALQANPSYATGHQWYATLLNATGRPEEALRELERAREEDPLSYIINGNLGDELFYLGRYDEALARYRAALELNPEGPFYRGQYVLTLFHAGRTAEAVAGAQALLPQLDKSLTGDRASVGYTLARGGLVEEARAIARQLDELARDGSGAPVIRALVRVGLGDREEALALLEEGAAAKDPDFVFSIPMDPGFDPLRRDPRFIRLLERMRGPSR